MEKFGKKMTREILKKTRKDFGKYAWQSKESILFHVIQKYGESIDKDLAGKIYDELRKEES
jgi:hypothetical protein